MGYAITELLFGLTMKLIWVAANALRNFHYTILFDYRITLLFYDEVDLGGC